MSGTGFSDLIPGFGFCNFSPGPGLSSHGLRLDLPGQIRRKEVQILGLSLAAVQLQQSQQGCKGPAKHEKDGYTCVERRPSSTSPATTWAVAVAMCSEPTAME